MGYGGPRLDGIATRPIMEISATGGTVRCAMTNGLGPAWGG